jgi:hypothetical protein
LADRSKGPESLLQRNTASAVRGPKNKKLRGISPGSFHSHSAEMPTSASRYDHILFLLESSVKE